MLKPQIIPFPTPSYTAESANNKVTNLITPDDVTYPTSQTIVNALTTAKSIWVSTNGSNSTGKRGRFDLPFLTVAGAIGAAGITSGDVIRMRGGTFTETTMTLPTGIHLIGEGVDATIIQSNTNAVHSILNPGSGSYIGNLTIQGLRADGTFQYPIGQIGGSPFGTCTIFNVKLIGDTDALYNNISGNTYKCFNCDFNSKWDTVSFGAGRAELYNCVVRVAGPTSVSGTHAGRAIVAASHAQIIWMGGNCVVDGGTTFNAGLNQASASSDCVLEAYNVRFDIGTTGSTVSAYDAYKSTIPGVFRVGAIFRADGALPVLNPASGPIEYAGQVPVPSTASSSGSVGWWARDTSYAYFCVATDTWKRVAIATW